MSSVYPGPGPTQGPTSAGSPSLPEQGSRVGAATAEPLALGGSRPLPTGRPTSRPARRGLGVGFWGLGALLLALVGADAVLLIEVPASLRPVLSEGGQLSGYVVAVVCCAVGVARSPRGRVRQAWTWIGVAFVSNAVAESIFGYLVLMRHQSNPFPSLADPFYLLFYPLMAIGVSRLPAWPTTGAQRVLLALDALIVAGSLLSVSWFFLIGPLYLHGADSPFNLALSLAYPVGDLLIMMALFVLALRGFERAYRPVYLWLMAGMLVTICADSAYTYLNLQSAYATGLPTIDPLWPAAAFLIGLAPLYQMARFSRSGAALARLPQLGEQSDERPPSPSLARIVLPYVPVLLLMGLVSLAQFPIVDTRLVPTLEALALLVVGLIIVRQVMTLRENVVLARSQAGALRMLAEANAYNFEHARELEVGLQHLSAVQARIAQGDFSARVPVLHGTTLFPVTSMLNVMLERVESRMRASQQSEQVAALALRLAEICRSAEAGDWSALQVLAQPSGTALDPIARVVASLQRRAAEQGAGWQGNSPFPWMAP